MAEPVNNPDTITLLQYAGIVGAFIGTAIAAFFGIKSKARRGEEAELPSSRGVEWFFDGPVGKVLGILEGIYRLLQQIREDSGRREIDAARRNDETARRQERREEESARRHAEHVELLRELKERVKDLRQRAGRPPRD